MIYVEGAALIFCPTGATGERLLPETMGSGKRFHGAGRKGHGARGVVFEGDVVQGGLFIVLATAVRI